MKKNYRGREKREREERRHWEEEKGDMGRAGELHRLPMYRGRESARAQ